jgi:lysophospholipid acyltransferase (LPLAT)-like uncharacterized protein
MTYVNGKLQPGRERTTGAVSIQTNQARLISIWAIVSFSSGITLRWKTEGLRHFDAIVAGGHQPVIAFWHGRILPAYYFRRRGIVVITSENFDGSGSPASSSLGYGTARGSIAVDPRRCCS